jgi:ribonuclease VapC
MFVDASIIVAVLTEEPDAEALSYRIERGAGLFTSPIALFEAVIAVGRKSRLDQETVRSRVQAWLDGARISTRSVDPEMGVLALAAHARYGKGTGHPARLNLGDCFAYAMAKQHGVALLYKGDDFAQTDLA